MNRKCQSSTGVETHFELASVLAGSCGLSRVGANDESQKRNPAQVDGVNMKRRNAVLVIAFGLATLGSNFAAWSEEVDQALIKAIPGAKITLLQGIAQVAKGTEVPTEAKYEMEDGKLMLSVYTSAKGFDTAAEDNSFNEYGGEATSSTWVPNKEVFTDLKHIARSAQYHTLLSMTKVTIPAI